jgi:hypothetical protein
MLRNLDDAWDGSDGRTVIGFLVEGEEIDALAVPPNWCD